MPNWFVPALAISGVIALLTGLRRAKDKAEGRGQ